jgi:two-component system LytT family sensor kinase
MFKKNLPTFIEHFLFWAIFLSLPLIFISGLPVDVKILPILFSFKYLIFIITYIAVFYFNSSFLVPKFYVRKRLSMYFACILILLVAVAFIRPFEGLLSMNRPPRFPDRNNIRQILPEYDSSRPILPPPPTMNDGGPPRKIDLLGILLFIMVIGLSTVARITKQWSQTEKRAARAEADKANAELSFLKAQINPHFLFNTLNNIYSLAISKNENTATCIMQLSNIMRYVTDEATEDFVPLQDEINCIEDYIGLQQVRLGEKADIDLEIKGDAKNKKIAPLILMSFIENVFKYGISKRELSPIKIKLYSETNTITFICQNKIFKPVVLDNRKGVGIVNSKKRLEHLYQNKHFLHIISANGLFIVELTLQA